MPHWKVKYTERGMEPPRPFGKTSRVVCAKTREEAKGMVRASSGYPCTASRTDDRVSFGHYCSCKVPSASLKPSESDPCVCEDCGGLFRGNLVHDCSGRLPLFVPQGARVCSYHADSPTWDACSEGFAGCWYAVTRPAHLREKERVT